MEVEACFASYVADLPRFAYPVAFILLPLPFFWISISPLLMCVSRGRGRGLVVAGRNGGRTRTDWHTEYEGLKTQSAISRSLKTVVSTNSHELRGSESVA